jgi:hypothetical protein
MRGQASKAIPIFLFHPVKSEILECFEGAKVKQNHDKQHLGQAKFALATTLAICRDQVMAFPIRIGFGKIV